VQTLLPVTNAHLRNSLSTVSSAIVLLSIWAAALISHLLLCNKELTSCLNYYQFESTARAMSMSNSLS